MFVNALTAHHKYSLPNGDNLRQPNQMELSKKQETSSQNFFAVLKSTLNFEHFPKKTKNPDS